LISAPPSLRRSDYVLAGGGEADVRASSCRVDGSSWLADR